jgi:hypothetical protein
MKTSLNERWIMTHAAGIAGEHNNSLNQPKNPWKQYHQ